MIKCITLITYSNTQPRRKCVANLAMADMVPLADGLSFRSAQVKSSDKTKYRVAVTLRVLPNKEKGAQRIDLSVKGVDTVYKKQPLIISQITETV